MSDRISKVGLWVELGTLTGHSLSLVLEYSVPGAGQFPLWNRGVFAIRWVKRTMWLLFLSQRLRRALHRTAESEFSSVRNTLYKNYTNGRPWIKRRV